MKAAGHHPRLSRNTMISLGIMAIAIAIGLYINHRAIAYPATDDASIDADIVHVASTVGGRIVDIPVSENAPVKPGDVLVVPESIF